MSLQSKSVYKYSVHFESEHKFNISFIKTYAFGQFWTGYEIFSQIETITDLNTYQNREDNPKTPKDLMVLNSDRMAILWPEPGDLTYATNTILCARSEGHNELSIFDPTKRSIEYWNQSDVKNCKKWKGVKLSDVIDIKALVYF